MSQDCNCGLCMLSKEMVEMARTKTGVSLSFTAVHDGIAEVVSTKLNEMVQAEREKGKGGEADELLSQLPPGLRELLQGMVGGDAKVVVMGEDGQMQELDGKGGDLRQKLAEALGRPSADQVGKEMLKQTMAARGVIESLRDMGVAADHGNGKQLLEAHAERTASYIRDAEGTGNERMLLAAMTIEQDLLETLEAVVRDYHHRWLAGDATAAEVAVIAASMAKSAVMRQEASNIVAHPDFLPLKARFITVTKVVLSSAVVCLEAVRNGMRPAETH